MLDDTQQAGGAQSAPQRDEAAIKAGTTRQPSSTSRGNVFEKSHFLSDQYYPEITEIDAYWSARRGDRVMPARSDIDPRGILGALSHCFMLERLAPRVTRIRLAGQVLNDLAGMEVRGMSLNAVFAPQFHDDLEHICEDVCAKPAIARLALSAERGVQRPSLDARMVLWPLTDDAGMTTRIIGGLSLKGLPGHRPRRFMIASQRQRVLNGTSILPPHMPPATDASPHHCARQGNNPPEEAPYGFAVPSDTAAKPHSHLQLIHTQD
jgi:hypothetical protein